MTRTLYLKLRADGHATVLSRRPSSLNADEIAYRLLVNYPDAWGRVQTPDLVIDVPAAPTALLDDAPMIGDES